MSELTVNPVNQQSGAPAAGLPAPIQRTDGLFDGGRVLGILYLVTFVIVALLVVIPLVALIYGSLRNAAPGLPGEWTLDNWAGLASPGVVGSCLTTIGIGVAASVLASVVGTAIAIIVHRTDFRGASTVTALVSISFFLPSFILAMAWIIIGSPGGLINGVLQRGGTLHWHDTGQHERDLVGVFAEQNGQLAKALHYRC